MTVRCPFCDDLSGSMTLDDSVVFAIRDRYPVTTGHTLIISKRHVETWFDLDRNERIAVLDAIETVKAELDREFSPDGYNVGFNAGRAAGQTVMHMHVHVIPRYNDDVDDPRGGVRGVIPSKQKYE
ncbi:MAG: HIT family protein [bacterium]